MQNREMTDFRKVDVIEPTPKQVYTRMQGECMYCQYDAPHPPTTPIRLVEQRLGQQKGKG